MSTITTIEDVQRSSTNGNITTFLTPLSAPLIEPDSGVITYWADVTPSQARELLKMNTHNRFLSKRDVKKLRGAINRGEYKLNTNGLDISPEGILLDGQHRLEAIASGERAVRLQINENVPTEAQEVTDIGKKRKLNQMLDLRGELDHNQLGPAVRVVFNYVHNGILDTQGLKEQPTNQQLFDLLDAHPEIRSSAKLVGKNKAITRLMTPGIATALHYLCTQTDPKAGDDFFRAIAQGGMSDIPQANLLHDALYRGSTAAQRLPTKRRAAYTVKAWNAWREGRDISVLRWGGGNHKVGSHYANEKFPLIKGCPIKPAKK